MKTTVTSDLKSDIYSHETSLHVSTFVFAVHDCR